MRTHPSYLLRCCTFTWDMKETLDVVIIGGGPIGLATGIECQKRDLSYVILEKGVLVNSLYNYPQNMTFFSTSDKLEIGDVPFISHNTKPTRSEALEYYRRVTSSWKLNVHTFEGVKNVEKREGISLLFLRKAPTRRDASSSQQGSTVLTPYKLDRNYQSI